MAAKNLNFKYDLSIAMIVKNEEKCLRRTLESMLPLRDELKCQLIITDTGSTDSTIKIAEEFADTLINFEWIDDFAAARNTGVKAAEGRWFMYVDADEYFDETIIEIAKFIKSPASKKSTYASLINRSYTESQMILYSDSHLPRLINFSDGKEYFKGKVHEVIYITPCINNPALETIMHHTGYMDDLNKKKHDRNGPLIEKHLEENPDDIRFYLLLSENKSNPADALEVCQRALNRAKETNQMNVVYIQFLHVLFVKSYLKLKKFDEVYKYTDEYLENEKRFLISRQEILYMAGVAAQHQKDHEKTKKYFMLFNENYEAMKVNFDNIYSMFGVYNYNKDYYYELSMLMCSLACIELDDQENAKELYTKTKIYRHVNAKGELEHFENYVKTGLKQSTFEVTIDAYKEISTDENLRTQAIKIIERVFNTALTPELRRLTYAKFEGDLYDGYTALNWLRHCSLNLNECPNVIKNIKADSLLYKEDAFVDAFYASFLIDEDVFGFVENLKMKKLYEYVVAVFKKFPDCSSVAYEKLLGYTSHETGSAKFDCFNSYVAYVYLIHAGQDKSMEPTHVQRVKIMFEYFVRNTYEYIKKMYIIENFKYNSEIINDRDVFCYYAYGAIEKRNTNPIEYIRGLRNALKHNSSLSNCVNIILDDFKAYMNGTDSARTEFLMLGEQVKSQIKTFIAQGNKDSALAVTDQYSKVNPMDYEIADLYDEIDKMM